MVSIWRGVRDDTQDRTTRYGEATLNLGCPRREVRLTNADASYAEVCCVPSKAADLRDFPLDLWIRTE